MTLKFNRILEVVEIHVHAKFHQATCSDSSYQQCTRFRTTLQGGPKKTAPNFSCNNFGKYGPIL